VKELDTVISELERKRDEESGSVMKKLEDTLSENKKLEALAQSAVDDKKDGLKAENKRKKELTKNSNDVRILCLTSNIYIFFEFLKVIFGFLHLAAIFVKLRLSAKKHESSQVWLLPWAICLTLLLTTMLKPKGKSI
jgi:hypothetical protein